MIKGSAIRQVRRAIPIYLVLLAIVVITALLSSDFRTHGNFINVIAQVAPLAIVALGQTIVILLGGIDLSVGSVISLSTVILAAYAGMDGFAPIRGVSLSLAAGVLVGLVNGLGVVKFRVPPLIMTLSTMAVIKGLALYLLPYPGGSVPYSFASFVNASFGWFSVVGVIVILFYAVFWVLLSWTRFGRYVYAIGGGIEPARRSGILVGQIQVTGYVLSGGVAAACGLTLAARIHSGDPVIGDAFSLDSVASVVVGGTSLFGGVGGVVGTLAGSIILAISNNVLNLLNVFSFYQYIIKGLILVAALFFYHVRRGSLRWRRKR